MRILLIEDDVDLKEFIKENLEEDAFAVDATSDGERGSYLARTNTYDVILLDLSLPRKDGLSITKELRSKGDATPIIILSVTSELPAKVMLFESGVDDYITKPFELKELLARIRAILRRPKKIELSVITVGDLVLDINRQTVTRSDKKVYLTRKEFSLLEYLMKNKGVVLARGAILEHVWNASSDPFSNTIEAHILNLRKKIGDKAERQLIHNIPGRGYKIDVMK